MFSSGLFNEFVAFGPEREFPEKNKLPDDHSDDERHDCVCVVCPFVLACIANYCDSYPVMNLVIFCPQGEYLTRRSNRIDRQPMTSGRCTLFCSATQECTVSLFCSKCCSLKSVSGLHSPAGLTLQLHTRRTRCSMTCL